MEFRTGQFNMVVPDDVIETIQKDGLIATWRTGTDDEVIKGMNHQLQNMTVVDDVTGVMTTEKLVHIIYVAKELLRRSGVDDEQFYHYLAEQEKLIGRYTKNMILETVKEDLDKNPCTEPCIIYSDDPDQWMCLEHVETGLMVTIENDYVDDDEDGGPYEVIFDKERLGQLSNFIKEVKNGNKPENLKFNVEFENKTLTLNVELNLNYDPSTKYIDFLLDATDCYCDVEFGDDLDKLEKYIIVALERLA